ncbi:glycoside hydrolase family 64 protein [Streptomyces sp. A15ISP2-DRY2]|uniref:Glycoside hydrolase family 64 protein n=1 Tax=Streptomyces ortus TaxID=2867268 RepID=A0ABT3V9N2_9ACTN|nr:MULTISPECIES: glycoside hydrolase family 64 protein [Streptomyces]MCX4236649.1 glycoside hydrolase family 64 protein [Streptomyces ortus]
MLSPRKLTASLAVAAALGAVAIVAGPADRASAVADTIPLTLKNTSGSGEQVYVYVIGTELASGKQGYADETGTFHAWPAGGAPPVPAPDASFAGPADGASKTVRLPKFSGRVYFSYGQKLDFRLADGGLVQPAVQNASDPNHDTLFNWTEYTLNDSGLWLNSTQVDMFSAPYSVGLTAGDGSTKETGKLKPGGYRAVVDGLKAQGGGWEGLVESRGDGTPLRVLAPGHAIGSGAIPADVMNDYIDRVWTKYATDTLTVTPFKDQPDKKFQGKVNGDKMDFTDGTGAVVTSFDKPDSDSVFGCYNKLDAPNDQVRGPISRTLCAAYNRSTLLSNSEQPDADASGFYQDGVTNHYARLVHEQMQNGQAYAFAFDDVGNHESLVHDGDPKDATISLDSFE